MHITEERDSAGITYRPDIDGLRAIAVLLVVGYHYFAFRGDGENIQALFSLSRGGYVGVDVFFVISGFLITSILLTELDGSARSLLEFYARRTRRIFPPLLIVIVATLFIGWQLWPAGESRELGLHAAAGAVYLSNFLLWKESGYFDTASETKAFLHLWSLAIEEQFYVVWPFLLLTFKRWRYGIGGGIMLVIAFSFAVNVAFIRHDQSAVFYLPLTRMWELAAGGGLAWAKMNAKAFRFSMLNELDARTLGQLRNLLAITGFGLVLGAALTLDRTSAFPGYLATIPVFGALLMLAAGPSAAINSRILAFPALVIVGKISYSLYLWHWPVLVLAYSAIGKSDPLLLKSACFLLSVLLAWATYVAVERPVRLVKVDQRNSIYVIATGLVVTLTVAALGYLLSIGATGGGRALNLMQTGYARPFVGCYANGNYNKTADTSVFARCEQRAHMASPLVFLVGDSHALALYQGLQPFLNERHIDLIGYPVIFCTPLSTRDKRSACVDYNRYILERIQSQKPDLVVLSAHHLMWATDHAFNETVDYGSFVRDKMKSLLGAGASRVLVIGEVPNWEPALPVLLNREYLGLGKAVPSRMMTGLKSASLQIDTDMKTKFAGSTVPYYSMKEALCDAQGCLTKVGDVLPDQLVVFDDSHLTVDAASFVVGNGLGQTVAGLIGKNR